MTENPTAFAATRPHPPNDFNPNASDEGLRQENTRLKDLVVKLSTIIVPERK